MSPRALCVIGNSHLVAFQQGWQASPDVTQGHDVRFFALPAPEMLSLRVENGRLIPTTLRAAEFLAATSDGAAYIDLAAFDAFVLVGAHFFALPIVQLYDHHRLAAHAEADLPLVSRSLLRHLARRSLMATGGHALLRLLRAASDKPILVLPEPLMAAGIRQHPVKGAAWTTPHLDFLMELYAEALAGLCTMMSARLVAQPRETVVDGAFSDTAYQKGARRLFGGREYTEADEDFRHMNAEFGAIMVREALQALKG